MGQEKHISHVITKEDGLGYEVWQCDLCGAYAGTLELIKHYNGCIINDEEAIKNLNRMVEENAQAFREDEDDNQN